MMLRPHHKIFLNRLLSVHGEIIGRAHIKSNQPCQDYTVTGSYRGRLVAVVCDGAGSASHSHLGAKFCATWLLEKLKKIKGKITQEDKVKILSSLQSHLKKYALELGCHIKNLSCTIVATVISEYGIECLHLGDSILIAYHSKMSHFITPPMNGEFSNETYFITHEKAPEKARLYTKPYEGELLILCTDGVSSSLISQHNQMIAPLVSKLQKALHEENQAKAQDILSQQLLPLFQQKTFDDCGLALIYEHQQEVSSWDLESFLKAYTPVEDGMRKIRRPYILYHAFTIEIKKYMAASYLLDTSALILYSLNQPSIDKISSLCKIPKKTVHRALQTNRYQYYLKIQRVNHEHK